MHKKGNRKVLIDVSFVDTGNLINSNAVYALRLVDAIPEERIPDYILLASRENAFLIRKRYPDFHIRIWKRCPVLNRVLRLFPEIKKGYMKFSFSRALDYGDHGTVLMTTTAIDSLNLVRLKRKRKVIVIHDLIVLKIDDIPLCPQQWYEIIRKYLNSAGRIIAISEYTKKDISRVFNIAPDCIDVVYNSVKIADNSTPPQNVLPSKYILYVSTLRQYKNPLTLLRAFASLKDRISEDLVFVGNQINGYWDNVLFPVIQREQLTQRVHWLQGMSGEELRFCYENASVFVAPSHLEGFGYTPIEAAICGCPVISSKCEALPEVTEGRVNYYEPEDDHISLANTIVDVLQNRDSAHLKTASDYFVEKYSASNQIKGFEKVLFSDRLKI